MAKYPTWRRFALLVAMCMLASVAFADTVTIGGTNSNNCFPFGCSNYVGEYQQVYSSTAFSGPVTISSLEFFSWLNPGPASISGTFSIHLSTTSAAVNGLSTIYSSNIGADNTLFFSGSVSNVSGFSGSFNYDPSQGNLLMDVLASSVSGTAELAGSNDPLSSRVFNWNGNGAPTADSTSLRTQIGYNSSAVPEPASFVLFGSGLLGLAGIVRKRLR